MGSLLRYVALRALMIIPTVLILYTIVFVVLRVIPGDPVLAALGTKSVPPEELERLRAQLGLDKPLYAQYFEYLMGVLRLDFGESMVYQGRPVWRDIAERFPATLELAVFGFLASAVIGVAAGIAAVTARGPLRALAGLYAVTGYTLFIPWLGLILIYFFAVNPVLPFRLPVGGRLSPEVGLREVTGLYVVDSIITGNPAALIDTLAHLVLPSLTLGIVLGSAYARLVRSHLREVLAGEVVAGYRARGLPEGLVMRHALRNTMVPIVTYMGLQFALLLGGAVLTETTFSWPGLGTLLLERIQLRDYTAIQGVVIFFAFMVGLVSLVVDVIYALLDPRIRY